MCLRVSTGMEVRGSQGNGLQGRPSRKQGVGGGWVHDHFKTHEKGNDGDGTCVSGQKVLEHYRME